jgi:hypothetical protein
LASRLTTALSSNDVAALKAALSSSLANEQDLANAVAVRDAAIQALRARFNALVAKLESLDLVVAEQVNFATI